MRQKTFNSDRPENPFTIENIKNGKCTILFFDNIEEVPPVEEGENVSYKYDLYIMKDVPFRESLSGEVQNNLQSWLNTAKELDRKEVGSKIKAWRNEELEKTDYTQQVDAPFTEEVKQKYRTYRQALRDIPQQVGFPYDVIYPVLEE